MMNRKYVGLCILCLTAVGAAMLSVTRPADALTPVSAGQINAQDRQPAGEVRDEHDGEAAPSGGTFAAATGPGVLTAMAIVIGLTSARRKING
jgi:hypothetical protein